MAWLQSFFGKNISRTGKINLLLDLVIETAELASNPDDIDLMLDEVRKITATMNPGQNLSPVNEQILLGVYLRLEQYLITQEPIRTFSKQELRGRFSEELQQKLAVHETAAPAGSVQP